MIGSAASQGRLEGLAQPLAGSTVRGRALVVDPDEISLAFAAEVLNSFRPGFEVATARSLTEAQQWLDTFRPDLILIHEDGADGRDGEGARELLDDPRLRGCRVIFFLSRGKSREAALAADHPSSRAVLPKPLSVQSILQAVRELAQHPKSR